MEQTGIKLFPCFEASSPLHVLYTPNINRRVPHIPCFPIKFFSMVSRPSITRLLSTLIKRKSVLLVSYWNNLTQKITISISEVSSYFRVPRSVLVELNRCPNMFNEADFLSSLLFSSSGLRVALLSGRFANEIESIIKLIWSIGLINNYRRFIVPFISPVTWD